eukprot:gene10319-12663_t
MQQIKLFLEDGQFDYMKLEGDTGPVVYPAGFLYMYSVLYKVTGGDIPSAQLIFVGVYLVLTLTVFAIYRNARSLPAYVIVFLCVSKRIHSIFALRLFNDCFSMLLFYVALYLFVKHRWSLGCLFFSMAVSIKMNLLLYAPSLLVLLLMTFGIVGTIPKLAICAFVQLVVAIPFLLVNPYGYLLRSFEFSRQFMYKWTVNWRFIPSDIFLSKQWAIGLLTLHISILLLFIFTKWCKTQGGIINAVKLGNKNKNSSLLSPDYIMMVMFTGNLIGITFSRSLHYQFYLWYFHTLPFLLWNSILPLPLRIIFLIATEYSWLKFPSTNESSMILLICNLTLIISLYFSPMPKPTNLDSKKKIK